MISVDYSKAFDKINHKLLIAKLKQFGLEEISIIFFINYLNSRSQFVSVDKRHSGSEIILSGVPQGFDPGSLLFLLYTADLPNFKKHSFVICR